MDLILDSVKTLAVVVALAVPRVVAEREEGS